MPVVRQAIHEDTPVVSLGSSRVNVNLIYRVTYAVAILFACLVAPLTDIPDVWKSKSKTLLFTHNPWLNLNRKNSGKYNSISTSPRTLNEHISSSKFILGLKKPH